MAVASSRVDVYLVLEREGRLLLALREGTGFCDGYWNLPSGKVDEGEHAAAALLREAGEEVGVALSPEEIRFVAVVHCLSPEQVSRVAMFFAATSVPDSQGEPFNAEPEKCAEIGWYPTDELPSPTQPITAAGVALYRSGRTYDAIGWNGVPPW